ncbi:uncharacterized protein LOC119583055 [Penaeus monodon]|uniref:uncharacterized protein LOC119583055 n=1 Tax=Penaeus monodon TaxID=6687 RepID=UPI0018A70B21|nr:uncharacterized protein LOC119583055 [Penaeus monodon]
MVMRGGRRAWWVGVVVLLLAKSTWGNFIVYKLGEPGMCTGFVKTLSTLTDTCCAMACSANNVCNAFDYQDGQCSLYKFLVQPGTSSLTCYVPEDALGASLPSIADLTTPARQETPSTTASAQQMSSTTTSRPGNDGATTPSSSGWSSSPVDFKDTSELRITLQQKCATNGGIIGIFKKSNIFYFLCRRSPNEIPLVVSDPGSPCSGTKVSCLSTTCDEDKIFIGYDQNGPKGPCYKVSSQQATVDKGDCYIETTAAPLPTGKGGSWTQWRVCRTDAFFVIVGADVSSGDILNITCCRAKTV